MKKVGCQRIKVGILCGSVVFTGPHHVSSPLTPEHMLRVVHQAISAQLHVFPSAPLISSSKGGTAPEPERSGGIPSPFSADPSSLNSLDSPADQPYSLAAGVICVHCTNSMDSARLVGGMGLSHSVHVLVPSAREPMT